MGKRNLFTAGRVLIVPNGLRISTEDGEDRATPIAFADRPEKGHVAYESV